MTFTVRNRWWGTHADLTSTVKDKAAGWIWESENSRGVPYCTCSRYCGSSASDKPAKRSMHDHRDIPIRERVESPYISMSSLRITIAVDEVDVMKCGHLAPTGLRTKRLYRVQTCRQVGSLVTPQEAIQRDQPRTSAPAPEPMACHGNVGWKTEAKDGVVAAALAAGRRQPCAASHLPVRHAHQQEHESFQGSNPKMPQYRSYLGRPRHQVWRLRRLLWRRSPRWQDEDGRRGSCKIPPLGLRDAKDLQCSSLAASPANIASRRISVFVPAWLLSQEAACPAAV